MRLENGQCYVGDLLVGADGIWSKVLYTCNSILFVENLETRYEKCEEMKSCYQLRMLGLK